MGALPALPRVWWATDLPGYREHPTPFSTYSPFPYTDLPRIVRELDVELNWLRAEPRVPGSLGYVVPGNPAPERAATLEPVAKESSPAPDYLCLVMPLRLLE